MSLLFQLDTGLEILCVLSGSRQREKRGAIQDPKVSHAVYQRPVLASLQVVYILYNNNPKSCETKTLQSSLHLSSPLKP
jgi:hypothetical protein